MAEEHETPQDDQEKNGPAGYAWHEVWLKVLANPSVKTFEEVLDSPDVSTRRALRWVFLASVAAAVIAIVAIVIQVNAYVILARFLPQILISIALNALIGVVSFAVVSLGLQFFARLAGGEGSYEDYHYALAASVAPMTVIRTLVMLTGASFIFIAALTLYQLVLAGVALRAVNKFTWGRTLVTMLAAGAAIGVLFVPLLTFLLGMLTGLFL